MVQEFQSKRQELARQSRYVRSKFHRINSLDLIPEHPGPDESGESDADGANVATTSTIASDRLDRITTSQQLERRQSRSLSRGVRKLLLFWPNLLVNLALTIVRYLLYVPLSIATPSFWLSAMLWIFWKLVRLPIAVVKWMLNVDALTASWSSSPARSPLGSSQRRTILISCGSTVQTLHLARNFYSSGARVVVFEFEGYFGLARFSTAVDKFYVVPRPTTSSADVYIAALCHIVSKERPSVYVPVCATSTAYYDALAKPHLELMGCASFIPGLQETAVLDDCLQLYRKCADQSIPLPPHSLLTSANDLWQLYDGGFIGKFRNILMAVGVQGLLERYKYILPQSRRNFKFAHEISESEQWLCVRDLPGEHFVTCTTVKDSRVVANVTCKVDHDTRNLMPVSAAGSSRCNASASSEEAQIEMWLRTFFAKVRFQRSINGHISFRMVKCQASGRFMPLGVRLGVSLPYICYNRSHAQILCRTMKCVHIRNKNNEEESALAALGSSWRWSALEKSSASAALDKREALFAYWDPLPYCAYYHFQLPLESVKTFLQKRHKRNTKTSTPLIAMPVH